MIVRRYTEYLFGTYTVKFTTVVTVNDKNFYTKL